MVERAKGPVASFHGSSFTHGKTHAAQAALAAVGQGERTAALHTTGWVPTCHCRADAPVPCTVLDPFAGTATTGLVARALGRHSVCLDLSWPYLQLARERLGLVALEHWAHGAPAVAIRLDDLPLFTTEHTR